MTATCCYAIAVNQTGGRGSFRITSMAQGGFRGLGTLALLRGGFRSWTVAVFADLQSVVDCTARLTG